VNEPQLLLAPAKLNLCLFVGPTREDGLHELASIFEPLALADELRVSPSEGSEDELVCPQIPGPNLVTKALAAMREQGWTSSPLRIEVDKRVPIAAGLGGGSADAAAVLRMARGEIDGLRALAVSVGADVPSQLTPRPCLVSGAGEVVEPIPPPGDHGVVLVPQTMGLTTAEVYAEADRLGLARGDAEIEVIRRKLRDAVLEGASPLSYPEHLVNDLEPAAISLRPEIEEPLAALREAGAAHAGVTGSGPTAFGLFADRSAAEAAATELTERFPTALATHPLDDPDQLDGRGGGG
jgi:4-diphosphocytidyl-2-C-methyl-D-erythritol kinase